MKLFDLINPCAIVRFFTLYGGGSGGGGTTNPDTRYANLDKLYGVQSQASEFMLDNAMPHIPDLTANSALMNQQAQDGTLATQMREQAGNNATASLGSALDANNRNMQRYGMGASANRLLSEGNRNAIMGAGMKVGEMNKANMFAEDQKWNRNANFYGQVMGMNNGAMSGLSSAGAGLSNVNAQQNQMDAANAKGYGQAGAAFSNALFKADGGYIDGESRRVEEKPAKLAKGGDAWAAYKAANPVAASSGSSGGGRRTNPYGAIIAGAAPGVLSAGLKDIFNVGGKGGKIVKAGKEAYEYAKHAKDFANGAQSLEQAQEFSNAAQASLDAGYTGAEAFGLADQSASYTDSAQAAADAAEFADTASTASDAATAAEFADTASTASEGADYYSWLSGSYAKGGAVKKPPKHFAVGGLANASVANSDKVDGSTVSKSDASNSMQVVKMDDLPKTGGKGTLETHAKPVAGGKEEDPDGFGTKSDDNRQAVGKAVLSYWIGVPGVGGAVADAIHPVMEQATRESIMFGDRVGKDTLGWALGDNTAGFIGASSMDPVGAVFSGKYFADGGLADVSKDLTSGGKVQGPGTETSDSIPAQLSDGEVVENAEAVKLDPAITKQVIGKWDQKGGDTKDLLLAINDAGLAVRQSKKPVKMAGGGFLGGNLGIALGAGVDQMGRERELDRADRAAKLAENADARAEAMQAPRLEGARLENANSQLGLEAGQRQAEIAKAAQKHELGLTDDKYGLLKQEIRNKMDAGVLTRAAAQLQALDHFGRVAETNPMEANRALQDPDFKALLNFRDAEFIPGTKDGLKVTDLDGRSYSTTIGALKTKQPMTIKEVSAGAKLVGIDPKTHKVTELAQGGQKPEHADHQRVLVNDAIGQIAMAYGAKLDPITKMLDTSAIKDPDGYTKAIAAAEARVRAGEHPMAVASDIATKGRKEAAVKGLSSKGTSTTTSGGGYSSLWNK